MRRSHLGIIGPHPLGSNGKYLTIPAIDECAGVARAILGASDGRR